MYCGDVSSDVVGDTARFCWMARLSLRNSTDPAADTETERYAGNSVDDRDGDMNCVC
jgi:hypothetical protein